MFLGKHLNILVPIFGTCLRTRYFLFCSWKLHEFLWKSLISLRGPSQMDFENHRFPYLFTKLKPFGKYRKPTMLIFHKDFHCFELLGFPSELISLFYFSSKTSKIHTCENTCISKRIYIINEISTIPRLNITTKIHTFFL